jgi:hypothetical protein
MTLRERIQLDLSRGDIGSARTRLISAFVNSPYNPALAEEIARLSVQMHNPVEAGRWYFCCDSQDEHSAALIQLFASKHSSGPKQLLSQLPVKVRTTPPDQLPTAVRQRMNDLGKQVAASPPEDSDKPDWLLRSFGIGCLLGTILFIVAAVIGLGTIAQWLFNR